jgi:Family of unknown function (DUF6941)
MDAKVLLCDFAEVSGGKLFISGAGIGVLASATPAAPYRTSVSLAILVQLTVDDTDVPHKMTIELVYADGGKEARVILNDELPEDADPDDRGTILAQFMVPRNPQMETADELILPMAIPLFGLPLPEIGLYYFSVRIDNREMDRATFRAVVQPQEPQVVAAGGDGAGEPPL